MLRTFYNKILTCSKTLFNNDKQVKEKMMNVVIKQFVCVLNTIFTSLILVAGYLCIYYTSTGKYNSVRMTIAGIVVIYRSFDQLFNRICLILQYEVFGQWYSKLVCLNIVILVSKNITVVKISRQCPHPYHHQSRQVLMLLSE